ncbi:hypothetical protein PBT90_03240 [Algoriphagus halophytocola]|uniref:Uncharacterized protein n=1 Tax=Algoriphagus halophytocola TaxID=2991499 RepID=A0ABY6MFM9_9BACT|nr:MULTISPECIES: hypothetical protein [unclassified Algoriphagus]UZD22443.1 hypothetical protein OM944_17520 [Algoriphagus sp. TR-M5]WBL43703.1 hypothetical protein PBT90_03240 [Algoriphagus sp. TR-M9]
MEHSRLVTAFRNEGVLHLKEGNGKVLTLLRPDLWNPELGEDWVYLLFDLFQIRTICEAFSEVSLDIVEFGSKPTIYHSDPNRIIADGPRVNGNLKFSLIREPNWNKLLFQISQPVLVKMDTKEKTDFQTSLVFPLLSPATKELYLGPEGEVKIIKR